MPHDASPLCYAIDPVRRTIHLDLIAACPGSPLVDAVRAVARHRNYAPEFDVIVSCDRLSRLPSVEQVRALGAQWGGIGSMIHRGKVAIVAGDDLAFGIARMFEALSGVASDSLCAFRTHESALEWLGAELAAATPA